MGEKPSDYNHDRDVDLIFVNVDQFHFARFEFTDSLISPIKVKVNMFYPVH